MARFSILSKAARFIALSSTVAPDAINRVRGYGGHNTAVAGATLRVASATGVSIN